MYFLQITSLSRQTLNSSVCFMRTYLAFIIINFPHLRPSKDYSVSLFSVTKSIHIPHMLTDYIISMTKYFVLLDFDTYVLQPLTKALHTLLL